MFVRGEVPRLVHVPEETPEGVADRAADALAAPACDVHGAGPAEDPIHLRIVTPGCPSGTMEV